MPVDSSKTNKHDYRWGSNLDMPSRHMQSRKWGGTEISAVLQTGSRQEPLPEPATLRKLGTLCFCPPGHSLGGFPKEEVDAALPHLKAVDGRDWGSSRAFRGRTRVAPFGWDNPQNCVLHQQYKRNGNRKLKYTPLICLPPILCFPPGMMNTHLQWIYSPNQLETTLGALIELNQAVLTVPSKTHQRLTYPDKVGIH